MKKSIVILLHIGYWMLYLLLLVFMLLLMRQGTTDSSFSSAWFVKLYYIFCVVPGLIGFYVSYTQLFPKFLQRKKIISLLLYGALTAIASALIGGVLMSIAVSSEIMFNDSIYSAIGETLTMAIIALVHISIALVIRGFINWYADIKVKADLSQKNHEMELALIKSQINPHFLFNTINNIDVLITKDPIRASSYLNKLSDIMRFMLYETKSEMISLSKELGYIEKFIELQKIRTANQDYLQYEVTGDASGRNVAPMIFIPFIENAFKHAENKKVENAIRINISIEKEKITFVCENAFNPNSATNQNYSGLGSDLIKKRLELLYPGRHTLSVSNNNNMYKVALTLFLYEN